MHGFEVNWLAVAAAAVAKFAIGGVWFSPVAFGPAWRAALGVPGPEMDAAMKARFVRCMIVDFIAGLAMAWVLANCLRFMGAVGLVPGVRTAFFLWLGFVATVLLSTAMYEGKRLALFGITGAYYLVAMLAMGGIIGVW